MSEIKSFSYLHNKFADTIAKPLDNVESLTKLQDAGRDLVSLCKEPPRTIEYTIRPILPQGGIGMIHGATGVGKSYFTLSLAYALSRGGEFLKYSVPQPQKVAYFDGELGKDSIQRYIQQIMVNQGDTVFPENLVTVPYDLCPDQTMPRIETNPTLYFEYIMDNGFNGLFIDNLATCTDIDENNPKEWKIIQRLFLRFRSQGKFVWLVHHAGADKTKARGVTARIDTFNTVISLQKIETVDELDQKIRIVYQKSRDFYGKDSASFEATHHLNGTWSYQDIELSTYEMVIKCFLSEMRQVDIAKYLNISQPTVYNHKIRAQAAGRLSVKIR